MDHSSRFRAASKTLGPPPWFQVQPDSVARFRLFCFPYAGGGSAIYRGWCKPLSPRVEVVPALLPGREFRIRELALTNIEPLVESIAREIFPFLDRPFALFGHSMGAIIAFELARRLRWERSIEPDHLFISARRAPQLPERDPEIHNLPDTEFSKEVEKMQGTPKEVLEHAELMQLIMPMLRADFAVCRTYTYIPSAPLKCPITALGGILDDTAPREKLEPWAAQTTGTFAVHMLDGDHFFINAQQTAIFDIVERSLH